MFDGVWNRFPFDVLGDHLAGIKRQRICVRSSLGVDLLGMIHTPAHAERRVEGTIPCIVIVKGIHTSACDHHDIISSYTMHGFAVVTYVCRELDHSSTMFCSAEIGDVHVVYTYITTQFPWINAQQVFLMGASYCGGIVLRGLTMSNNLYCGGVVMSPLSRLSSLISQDRNSVPLISNNGIARLLRTSSIKTQKNLMFRLFGTRSVRARGVLTMDKADKARYDLSTIRVPIYAHINIQDSVVDAYHTTKLFKVVVSSDHPSRTHDRTGSCIRYRHGDHGESETREATRMIVYNDAFQWCRSILHQASIQTYMTYIDDLSQAETQSTPLPPDGTKRMSTDDSRRIVLLAPNPVYYLGCITGALSTWLIPLGPLLRFHHHLVWSQIVLAPLHTSGFPTVTLCLTPSLYDIGFRVHLIEYNAYGYGRQLVQKYVRGHRSNSETTIIVRMPMVAAKISVGHRLVLSITNYQDRSFDCVNQTGVSTILFKTISLPYLFDY
jgi:hypothetical protein